MSTTSHRAGWRSPATAGAGPIARGRPIRFSYVPALDGLRAISVLGVMLYHGGAPILSGGFLTIDVFFVLSGFLITSLLLGEWAKRLSIRLGQFWARRARRLLPALLVMLIGVAIYAKVFATPGEFADLRLDSLSTLFYVANWHFIASGGNYFNLTAQPSPLAHMWSLSIEEQFYIVWPPVALAHAPARTPAAPVAPAVAPVGHRRGRGGRLGPRHAALLPARRLGHAALRGDRHPLPGHPGGGGPGHRHVPVGRAPKGGAPGGDPTVRPFRACPSRRRHHRCRTPAPSSARPPSTPGPEPQAHPGLGDQLLAGPGPPPGARLVRPGRGRLPVDPADRTHRLPVRGRLLPLRPGGGHRHLLRRHRPDGIAGPCPRATPSSATSARSPTAPTSGTSRSSPSSMPSGCTSTACPC